MWGNELRRRVYSMRFIARLNMLPSLVGNNKMNVKCIDAVCAYLSKEIGPVVKQGYFEL